MSSNLNKQAYWKANLKLISICLTIWAFASYGCALILRPALTYFSFAGADLGFWFAQQGSIMTFIGVIFFYAWRMNQLDKEYGLDEE